MKRFVFTIALVAMNIAAFAQRNVEPEYIGQVVILNADSTTILLPTENMSPKTSSNMLGYIPVPGASLLSKSKSDLVMKGAEAKTVVDGREVVLIFRAADVNINPADLFAITKFEVKKKNRFITLAEGNLITGVKSNTNFNTENYEVKKFGNSSFMITLKNLAPGQYGVMTPDLSKAATFMVR